MEIRSIILITVTLIMTRENAVFYKAYGLRWLLHGKS